MNKTLEARFLGKIVWFHMCGIIVVNMSLMLYMLHL